MNLAILFLLKKGVKYLDTSRISTLGFGEEKPIGDNNRAAGRKINRRVQFAVGKNLNIYILTKKPCDRKAFFYIYLNQSLLI